MYPLMVSCLRLQHFNFNLILKSLSTWSRHYQLRQQAANILRVSASLNRPIVLSQWPKGSSTAQLEAMRSRGREQWSSADGGMARTEWARCGKPLSLIPFARLGEPPCCVVLDYSILLLPPGMLFVRTNPLSLIHISEPTRR